MIKSYGTLRYLPKENQWELEVVPHVALKIKQVFGKMDKRKYKKLHISATPENSRDLEWFMIKYPLEVKDPEILTIKSQAHKDKEAAFDLLLRGMGTFETTELKEPAREYQLFAAQAWLISKGLLLGDEVGVGKTVSAICGFNRPQMLPAMVVTLTHLPWQWEREIHRFTGLSTHVLKKGTPYDITNFHEGKFPDVIITNYHKLHGWADVLSSGGILKSITFDEGHELRRPESNKYAAAKAIADSVEYRLACTATPIMNYGGEIYNVLDVTSPGALGTQEEFNREWCIPTGNGKYKVADPEALGTYLRDAGLMLRRTRKDVQRELPDVTTVIHHIQSDPRVIMKMQGEAIELAKLILSQEVESFKGERMKAAGEFDSKMRQATGIAKCMAPGTRVVRYDGTLALVEEVKVGDLLMGPDSLPRKVTHTSEGFGEMFEISSTSRAPKFIPYTVNSEHILALKHSGSVRKGDTGLFRPYHKGDHFEISVKDYIRKSKHFKRMLKGYKVGINFADKEVPLDPYFLGLWLGDGNSSDLGITTADTEIVDYIANVAKLHELNLSIKAPKRTAPTYRITKGGRGCGGNKLLTLMKDMNLIGNKHIPLPYLTNSRSVRLSLLAGLIDSDGGLNKNGRCYQISSKWRHLAESINYLAGSLGFHTKLTPQTNKCQTGNVWPFFRVSISGDGLELIPVKLERKGLHSPRLQVKEALRSGIQVKPLGEGPYYGFTLEGDGLYLLEDFTVTHNSPFAAEFIKLLHEESGEKIVVFAWHRAVHSILLEKLADLKPVLYSGSESPVQKEAARKAFTEGDSQVMIISLRSGAGLDGLQFVCKLGVWVELDWSPGVMHQNLGRINRDGQTDPVVAYYLLSSQGSDPIMSDILGLKKQQLDGLIDPDHENVVTAEVDPDHIKKLAAKFLAEHSAT